VVEGSEQADRPRHHGPNRTRGLLSLYPRGAQRGHGSRRGSRGAPRRSSTVPGRSAVAGEAHMSQEPNSPDTIIRYTAAVRTNHWIVAIGFVLAALSGMALFHPALFWLSELFGGGPWTRILHPYVGLVMVVAFLFLATTLWTDNRMQPRDWTWLKRWRDVVNNRE